jgi:hypothetical protein
LAHYKATIKALTKFGDRREGTDRNRAAVDWIEAQLKSYGCTSTERIHCEWAPFIPPQARFPAGNRSAKAGQLREFAGEQPLARFWAHRLTASHLCRLPRELPAQQLKLCHREPAEYFRVIFRKPALHRLQELGIDPVEFLGQNFSQLWTIAFLRSGVPRDTRSPSNDGRIHATHWPIFEGGLRQCADQ